MITIKRIYLEWEEKDGYRVLVDRLWPRGVAKERARIDEWLRDMAPSHELRQWYCHKPELWDEFNQRYSFELGEASNRAHLIRLKQRSMIAPLTLLYAAKDEQYNNAVVIREVLERI